MHTLYFGCLTDPAGAEATPSPNPGLCRHIPSIRLDATVRLSAGRVLLWCRDRSHPSRHPLPSLVDPGAHREAQESSTIRSEKQATLLPRTGSAGVATPRTHAMLSEFRVFETTALPMKFPGKCVFFL